MTSDDMSRPVKIHCCRDGTITYRYRHQKIFNGVAIPVFSVDTEEQAKQLQLHFCSLQYTPHPKQTDRPWYRLTRFSGQVEDLPKVTEMFSTWYHERFAAR